jgi:formylglycine-generating enzyme required for sulfatase activity
MKHKISFLTLIFLTYFLILGQMFEGGHHFVLAQQRQLERPTSNTPQPLSEKRIALVIGNGAYRHAQSLENPKNDATDVSSSLRELGFEVIGGDQNGVNLNQRQMELLMREFGERLAATKGIGLFYYAGHGLQSNGQNYLVPVDADISEEDEVKYKAVPLGFVLDKMSSARNNFNLVILDACRNNPFARSWRSVRDASENKGLANSHPPRGTLILYATQPGDVSSDGTGRNGLFTSALLKQIKKPNFELDQLVKAVAREVEQASQQKQSPWKEGLYSGDFYFSLNVNVTVNIADNATKNTKTGRRSDAPITAKDPATIESEAWNDVRKSANAEDLRAFLEVYPSGNFSGQAKIRLEQLVWDSIKDSRDIDRVQAYLKEFPQGANTPRARIKLSQLKAAAPNTATTKAAAQPSNSSIAKQPESSSVAKLQKPLMLKKHPTAKANSIIKAEVGGIEFEFVNIPPGEFMMGFLTGGSNSQPVHKVTISRGFEMGRYEITQSQWKSVMGRNPSTYTPCENCPVEKVSWNDVQEFINWLNRWNDGYVYRLPTEAEWEYAARAGAIGNYITHLDKMAWTRENSPTAGTHQVGLLMPNDFGLYDMFGNVSELCSDFFGPYPSEPQVDPKGAASHWGHVYRGGDWFTPAEFAASQRIAIVPNDYQGHIGFRLVRTSR